jgi:hypothetical protein
MNIIYSRLFELSILHDYFLDGKAKDLKLLPTKETLDLFKKGRMLWRETPEGIIVLYRAEMDLITPEVVLDLPQNFFFYLESRDSAKFFNITELSKGPRKYSQGDLLCFENNPNSASQSPSSPEKITLDIWDGIKPKAFIQRVKLEQTPTKVLLQVKDSSGTQIPSGYDQNGNAHPLNLELTPDEKGEFYLEINLKGRPQGKYSIHLRNEANSLDLLKKEYFLADDAIGNPAVGVVKLSYLGSPSHLYGSKEFYALDLKRKSTKWTYFVVSQNKKVDLSTADLAILDKGNPAGSPYGLYNFQQVGTAPHAEIKVNNSDTVVFKSQVAIPFFENPKLNLELRRKPGNRVLFTHLPNPSRSATPKVAPGEEISEIYVFI